MAEKQNEALIQNLVGKYKINENRLESETVELQVCKRHKAWLKKGQSQKYLMLNRLGESEYVEENGEKKPYVSGLYPTQEKNHFEFSVNGSYFDLILKSATEAEVRRSGAILEFEGGSR